MQILSKLYYCDPMHALGINIYRSKILVRLSEILLIFRFQGLRKIIKASTFEPFSCLLKCTIDSYEDLI
jgi:hypothetical protein